MDVGDLNPIEKFEKLSRNQKLAVAGGAAALGGYLWYRSKSKAAAEAEGEGEEAASGTGVTAEGSNAEGNFLSDEGIIPEGGEVDPFLGGGFGGSAPANASNGTGPFTPTSTSDGTTPTTTNVGAGGVGTQNIGEGGIGTQNVTDVTGGGAPATPHPAVAHLTKKHPAHPSKHKVGSKKPAAKHGTKKTTKKTSQHTQHRRTVVQHRTSHRHKPAHRR